MLAEQGLMTGQSAQITREQVIDNVVEQTRAALMAAIRAEGS
jgi:hypothetical protein